MNQEQNNSNIGSTKKINLFLIIGVVIIVVVAVAVTIFTLTTKEGKSSEFDSSNNKTKLNSIVYVGGNDGTLIKTTNGIDWEKVTLPSNDKVKSSKLIVNGIKYVNNEYILYAREQSENGGSSNNTILYRSDDGIKWELLTFTVDGSYTDNWLSLNYIDNNYYIISQWGGSSTRQLYYGKDLHTTENLFKNDDLFENFDAYVVDYAYGNDKFVVNVGREKKYYENSDSKTKYFYISEDGSDFESNETDISLEEIEFGNDIFVGVASLENSGIYKSDNGKDWERIFEFDAWSSHYGLIYSDNNFYVWYDDTVYISNDGENWKEFYKNPDNQEINNFDYKNGVFAYTSMYMEKDKKTYEYVFTFKTFISNDGKEWLESTFDYKDYDFSSLYILEK